MSPKELNYIEDALGHEQFLMNQCQEAIQNLQDPALKNQAQQMEQTVSYTHLDVYKRQVYIMEILLFQGIICLLI